jgi:acyl carrier protein
MTEAIRAILKEHARIGMEDLRDDADLFVAGLTSHATVNVMLALEEHFGIEFPERAMRRRSFETVAAIRATIEELVGGAR